MSAEDSKLEWSTNPSAYEAHLMRKCGNPYFTEAQRSVSTGDLVEARRIDEEDYRNIERRFTEFCEVIRNRPNSESTAVHNMLRERIDKIIFFAMGVGGPAYRIASQANQVREALVKDIRAAYANDDEALEKIEKAEMLRKESVRKFYIPVLAQILREKSPIPPEDMIATIVSEDAETIQAVMRALPEDSQIMIRAGALKLVKQALDLGYLDPQFDEKLDALGVNEQ